MSKMKDHDVTRCRGCGQLRLLKETGTACLICSIYVTEHSTSFVTGEESKVCDPVYNRAVLRSIIDATDNYSKITAHDRDVTRFRVMS